MHRFKLNNLFIVVSPFVILLPVLTASTVLDTMLPSLVGSSPDKHGRRYQRPSSILSLPLQPQYCTSKPANLLPSNGSRGESFANYYTASSVYISRGRRSSWPSRKNVGTCFCGARPNDSCTVFPDVSMTPRPTRNQYGSHLPAISRAVCTG